MGRTVSFLEQYVTYRGDDCLLWPFSKTHKGYGQVSVGPGDVRRAHRVMCELAHGPAPTKKHHAAHLCGKGHLGCVNPRHLEWKTPKQNSGDRSRHGTSGTGFGPCRFSPEQVEEIRGLRGQVSARDLAPRYGVSINTIDNIWMGKTYSSPAKRYRRRQIRFVGN